ncbi:hydroxymethylbilane synthase [Orenia metallireducens]|jgi:hydroxymethylbilane synthase|uniref:Porphobilinogen deaminase n=1 Tax=Orenia metallireducens TaxID=1413210 RepID=A0A1C0A7E1_9FIRM|nr:hydroxymethylbilane synthase [Orenia metallireducens]OCL26150.1 hydroxymethylbilane synthase [Orenia metallireducens]
MSEIIIGTRKSKLAVAQSTLVAEELADKFPAYKFTLKKMSTKGDRITDRSLIEIGGKGLFIKEIELALLNGEIDLAVHSLKDMPGEIADEFEIIATPKRANPLDVLISKDDKSLDELPQGARIGTGSLRRKVQLLNYRPDLDIVPIRGNIDTRIKKLDSENLDAIILAAAGLERMGWSDRISQYLAPEISLPAVGQGALALEVRSNEDSVKELIRGINHCDTYVTVTAERSFLAYLEGSCKIPIAAYAQIEDDRLMIEGMVASLDGSRLLRDKLRGKREEAKELGIKLAQKLIKQGAAEILAEIKEG